MKKLKILTHQGAINVGNGCWRQKMGQFCLNSVAESCNYKSQHYGGIFFCSKAMKVANFQQQKDSFRVFYDTVETISGVKRSSGVNSTI